NQGRGADAVQRVGPVDVQEVDVVVILRRRIGQRPDVLDGVAVAQAQPREAALQRIAGEHRESARIGAVVQQVVRAELLVERKQVGSRQYGRFPRLVE